MNIVKRARSRRHTYPGMPVPKIQRCPRCGMASCDGAHDKGSSCHRTAVRELQQKLMQEDRAHAREVHAKLRSFLRLHRQEQEGGSEDHQEPVRNIPRCPTCGIATCDGAYDKGASCDSASRALAWEDWLSSVFRAAMAPSQEPAGSPLSQDAEEQSESLPVPPENQEPQG